MTRIIIAEDQPIYTEGLVHTLSDVENIELVTCVENGQILLDYLSTNNKVDLILMDIKMPVLNGIEATKLVKKHYPFIKVLVLSFYIKPMDLIQALDAGADGYLSKNTTGLEIIEAIQDLKKDKPYFSPEVNKILANAHAINGGKGILKLTNREKEALTFLSRGFSSDKISILMNISESTVKTYRKTLLEKFRASNSADLTRKAMEGGYI